MKKRNLILIVLFFFIESPFFQSQIVTKLNFTGSKREIKNSKRIIKENKISLTLGEEEINLNFKNDSFFVTEKISPYQLEMIQNQSFILLKLESTKRCSYFKISYFFFQVKEVDCFMIYHFQRSFSIFGKALFKGKSNGMVCQMGLFGLIYIYSSIPCKDFNGQFEEKTKVE